MPRITRPSSTNLHSTELAEQTPVSHSLKKTAFKYRLFLHETLLYLFLNANYGSNESKLTLIPRNSSLQNLFPQKANWQNLTLHLRDISNL